MILVEHYTSGEENYAGNDGEITRVYHAMQATSGIAARNAVLAFVPAVDLETGLVRKTIATSPKFPPTINQLGLPNADGIYECKVKYSKIENKIKLTIDGTPDKVKITKSLESISSSKVRDLSQQTALLDIIGGIDANATNFDISVTNSALEALGFVPPYEIIIDSELMNVNFHPGASELFVDRGRGGTTATSHLNAATITFLKPGPDHGGLINVGKDKVDGVDWFTPHMKLTMQWSAKYATLDPNYVTAVSLAGGKVNDQTIALTIKGQVYTFLRGELASHGGTFEDTSDDGVNVSLKFEVSRNGQVGIGERDGTNATWLSKIYKEGWHYGWMRTVAMRSNGIQIDVPNSFHVDRVAEYLDFDVFGIFDTISDEEE